MLNRFKRPIESVNRIWLATATLGTVFAIIAITLILGRLTPSQTIYQADFAQAASLRAGDAVNVAGIQVGTVNKLQLAGDRVKVFFKAEKGVHLGAQTRAAIKLTTLLGSRYLELSPAPDGELHDRTIPLANTSVPYDLQRTLADATSTFEQIDADRIAQSVGTLASSLHGLPQALPQALDNLKSLSGILAGRRDQLGTLLTSSDKVTTLIRNQRASLGSLIVQGRNLMAELVMRRDALQRLLAGATTLIGKTRGILDDQPAVNRFIAEQSDLLHRLHNNDALLRNTLQVLPVALRNMANSTATGMQQDSFAPAGLMIDSWMCAISGRAKQFHLPEYFQDCQPVPDPFPGFPPPYPAAAEFPGFPPDTLETNSPDGAQQPPQNSAQPPETPQSPNPAPPEGRSTP